MGILAWIVLGLLVGFIARAVLPGHDTVGSVAIMLIGVAGAVIGGFVAELLGFEGLGTFFELRTWLIALAGAVVLLALLRSARQGRSLRDPLPH